MIKVELHCHLDGAIPPDLFLQFAKEQGLVDCDDETFKKRVVMTEAIPLNEALKSFVLFTALLQTKDHLSRATEGLMDQKYTEGVRLLEIRFAPQLHDHLSMDEAVEAVLDGMNKGLKKYPDMAAGIIVCMMNNDRMDLNDQTIDLAYRYKDKGVVAIDLAGAEGYNRKENFNELLEKAHRLGLNITLHAGESQDSSFVDYAIAHHAMRIGHGTHASQDPETMEKLVETGILLESCPYSNLLSKSVETIEEHPIRRFFDMGIRICINTDDPLLLGNTLDFEYDLVKKTFGFSDSELIKMNLYAAEASFCKDKEKIIEKIKEEYQASLS